MSQRVKSSLPETTNLLATKDNMQKNDGDITFNTYINMLEVWCSVQLLYELIQTSTLFFQQVKQLLTFTFQG